MSAFLGSRGKATVAAFASSAVAFGGAAALLGAQASTASSHREAPQIIADPQVDNTDVYAFVSPDNTDTVTLIANWLPFEEPDGGPNFYPFADEAHYDINIDSNGDAVEDITYRWMFRTKDLRTLDTFLYNNGPVTSLRDENLLFRQFYTLEKIEGNKTTTLAKNVPVAPSNVGPPSMPDYASLRNQAVKDIQGGLKTFAGQADDPFFLDLRVFNLLYGLDLSLRGIDTLAGYNVNSVALQVPKSELTAPGEPVIGVWSDTERPSIRMQAPDGSQSFKGEYVQVSRLGNPLVNEVVIPVGLKDAFNALKPEKDATIDEVVERVNDPEVPKLIEAIYGIPAPKAPRDDLFAIFLTGIEGLNQPDNVVPAEMLRLNTSIAPSEEANRLGVLGGDNAGFPNGRRLTDDVVDIEIQALEGAVRTGEIVAPLATGDLVDSNDLPFNSTFPYLALPHDGGEGGGTDPEGGVAAGGGGTASSATTAPDRRSAAVQAPAQEGADMSSLALLAASLGAGLAVLGGVMLRRGRREASS